MSISASEILSQRGRPLEILPRRQIAPVAIVIGPHRSGTILCSNVLQALGINISGVSAGGGTQSDERDEFGMLHDRILALLNRTYDSPLHDLSLPPLWWTTPAVRSIKDELASMFRERIGPVPFGLADPQVSRLLPIWQQILRELNLKSKIVLCLRNPGQVARSLSVRDGVGQEIGEFRWFVYWTEIFRQIKNDDFCVIQYEDWSLDVATNVEKLSRFLNMDSEPNADYMRGAIAEIVTDHLTPDDPTYANARQPLVRSLYQAARTFDIDATARETVRRIADHFASYRQLNRHLEREFERLSGLVLTLGDTARDSADQPIPLQADALDLRRVRSDLIDGDRALVDTRHHGEQTAGWIENLQAGTKNRKAAVTDAKRDIGDWQATVDSLRDRLADRDAALVDAARHAAEQQAVLTAARAEVAAREQALANALRTLDEEVGTVDRLQADLSARDFALADAERQAVEQRAAFQTAQSDLAQARRALDYSQTALSQREATLAEATRLREEAGAALHAVRADLPAREIALANVERQAAEQHAAFQAAQSDLAQARRDLDYSQATLSRREATLAEATRLKEELDAALQAVRADLSAREVALAEAERRTTAERAAFLVAQRELVDSRAELVDSRAELVARDLALTEASRQSEKKAETIARLHGELATNSSELVARDLALTEASRQSEEKAETIARLHGDLAIARSELAVRDRALTAASRQSQERIDSIGRLQTELSAARKVARSLLFALRQDIPLVERCAARSKRDRLWQGWRVPLFSRKRL